MISDIEINPTMVITGSVAERSFTDKSLGPGSVIEQKLQQEGYSNSEIRNQDPLASLFSSTPGGDR